MTANDACYWSDHRVRAMLAGDWFESFDESRMIAFVTLDLGNEEGEEECEVRCKYDVCDCCGGSGSVVNPSIDAGGITASEWAEWDDEEQDMYMSGGYDINCPECHGKRVVPVPDAEYVDPKILKALEEEAQSAAECAAIQAAQRRMGA